MMRAAEVMAARVARVLMAVMEALVQELTISAQSPLFGPVEVGTAARVAAEVMEPGVVAARPSRFFEWRRVLVQYRHRMYASSAATARHLLIRIWQLSRA